jgi:arylsulfatase A-like enzyme/Flp pilus assembly protein TadD
MLYMKTRGVRGLLAIVLLAAAGCRSTSNQTTGGSSLRQTNVVLVTIDTLRADRLGCYGYREIETPNLDRLAQRGVLFENAVAQAPLTAPSHASMMTGLYPTRHKVRDTGGFVLSSSYPTLATILRREGWDTAAFVSSAVMKKRFGLNQGFAIYDDEMPTAGGGQLSGEAAQRIAAETVDRAARWLDGQSGRPFFLWVHLYDPHLPYSPPSPFREKYAGRPYDGEVAYADQQLGRLFDAVAKKSAPEKTIIAVLSDHGESFSEHGEYAHGIFLYDTTLRIPFLIAGPGVPAGLRIKQQARTIDLLPTLLELVGGKAPAAVQGASLAPAFKGTVVATDSYSETMFPKLNMGWAELRAIRNDRWKYVRAPRPELYDLSRDPGETNNIAGNNPEEVKRLEEKLTAMTGSGGSEKVEPAPVDPHTLEQLKSLGYMGGSSQQNYVLAGSGVDPKDRKEVQKLLFFGIYSELPVPRRIAMLRQAVAEDPMNPALYSNLGDLYTSAGRRHEAMELYESAVHKGIRSAWLFSRLGQSYLRQGRQKEAIPLFETAAQLNPSDYESRQNLAVAYRETGRLAEAEATLNAILKSGEQFAPAFNEMGMVSYQKGDLTAARGYFEKAAQLDAAYQLNLGRLYKAQGDSARARASFEAFLAAKESSPEYAAMIPQVKKELASVQ